MQSFNAINNANRKMNLKKKTNHNDIEYFDDGI